MRPRRTETNMGERSGSVGERGSRRSVGSQHGNVRRAMTFWYARGVAFWPTHNVSGRVALATIVASSTIELL